MGRVQIIQEGTEVIVLSEGGLFLRLPWEAAADVGTSLLTMARRAESAAKTEIILADADFLTETGAPAEMVHAMTAGLAPLPRVHTIATGGIKSRAAVGNIGGR